MPLTVPANIAAMFQTDVLKLATLWEITRVDGQTFYYTDHDKNLTFAGNVYKTGVGYDRSAIEDKGDLSPDNLNVAGILATGEITRADIRAGAFDGAEVWIRIVDWTNPNGGSLIRRRGWLGEVKQNNIGQFDTELRGLAEALSESLSRVYTPGCVSDLGSALGDNIEAPCGRKMVPDLWAEATYYAVGEEVRWYDNDEIVFRCINAGTTSTNPYDDLFYYAQIGDQITDGTVVWQAFEAWRIPATVRATPTPDRRTFYINISSARLAADPRHFDGGLCTFLTGDNATYSREIKYIDFDSDGEAELTLYLRMPFDVNAGDTMHLFPGCDKTLETCKTKFANSINYKGFPHVPGDDYLKQYPDSKR